ncbi:hypothetical protein [Photobacterium sanctipauli]|uniref:hypothetical protein n=1 Tax=Photobacterium sanctipauli TaxID=1342794 RepID=UPI000566E75C|nr:hypothetical protein [Photobacterium sanctipauli]
MKHSFSIACLALSFTSTSAHAIVIEAAGFAIVNTIEVPNEVPSDYGDLMFSRDGNTAYFIGDSEGTGSAVWQSSVSRDSNNNVTGFGSATQYFAESYIDTGLEYAFGTDTLFYRGVDPIIDDYSIAQRKPDGTTEHKVISNYDGEYGGLAFIPAGFGNAGGLLSTSYNDGAIFYHNVTDDGDGTYTIGDGVLFAGIGEDIGDLEYILTGALANTLLITDYGNGTILALEIDPITGLPVGGTSPVVSTFASDYENSWGLTIDPITQNIWAINYDSEPIVQIAAVDVAEPTPTIIFSIGLLSLLGWNRRSLGLLSITKPS